MSPEKKRQENTKRWLNNLSTERQAELKQKAREYHRNRYHNLVVEVKQFIMIYRVPFTGLFYMKLCLILFNNNFFIIKNVFQKLFMITDQTGEIELQQSPIYHTTNMPIYLYSRCYENCLCRVMWLAGSLTGEKYISKPCRVVCKMKQMTSLIQIALFIVFCHVTNLF